MKKMLRNMWTFEKGKLPSASLVIQRLSFLCLVTGLSIGVFVVSLIALFLMSGESLADLTSPPDPLLRYLLEWALWLVFWAVVVFVIGIPFFLQDLRKKIKAK